MHDLIQNPVPCKSVSMTWQMIAAFLVAFGLGYWARAARAGATADMPASAIDDLYERYYGRAND